MSDVSAPNSPPSNTVGVRSHLRDLAFLGGPLIGGHLAQYAIGLTDTAMLGWYSVEALAAVTLAGTYFFIVLLFGSGFAFAVMPMVAEAFAREDNRRIRRATRMGLWLSILYGAVVMPLFWFSEPIMLALGQSPEVAADSGIYLQVAGWGIFPALLVMVLKSYLGGLERAQAVLWITVFAAVANAGVNYLLIFGKLGFPEMGLMGAAIASLLTHVVSAVAALAVCLRRLPEHALMQNLHHPDWEMMGEVFRLGVPIGFTTLTEVSMFTASAIMMGWLGTEALAAHGIAVSLSGLWFMLHLGLSNAATIRVGKAVGRKDIGHLRRGGVVATWVSLVMAIATASLFVLIPETLIGLYLSEDQPQRDVILAMGVQLLAIAALFQLADGMQVVAMGLLRGLLDTGIPMVMAGFGYWVVGIPVAYVLGIWAGYGGQGIWMGLVFGLSTAGVLLMWRFWKLVLPREAEKAAQAA
jgi:MATE family multidrug resistance protein